MRHIPCGPNDGDGGRTIAPFLVELWNRDPPPWLGQRPKGPADSKAAASLHNKGVKSAHCIDKQLHAKEKGEETPTRDWHKLAMT